MRALESRLDSPLLTEHTVHGDERGFFLEGYRCDPFGQLRIDGEFVLDNPVPAQERAGNAL